MISSQIKEIMEDKGVTYVELERMTGLSNLTITRARSELIRECKLSTLEAIASALGVRIYDLFDDGLRGNEGAYWQEMPRLDEGRV